MAATLGPAIFVVPPPDLTNPFELSQLDRPLRGIVYNTHNAPLFVCFTPKRPSFVNSVTIHQHQTQPTMTYRIKHTLAGLLVTTALGFAQVSEGTASDDEQVFELSPFTVEDAQDGGYAATSTLAGSRIRSDIRDLGASISITTKDFLTDTGATDGESLLSLIGNVEVGGVLGNFSDASGNNTNDARNNPQDAQRVRGLSAASITRDYFQTNIPFDSYNTSRVEVNRGPNSILFGLGSPGGIINNTTNLARIGQRFGEVGFRVSHRGGHRATFDFNETIIEDRLAVRVNYMNEEVIFKQKPAFENDERYYVNFDLTIRKDNKDSWLGKTSIKGSFESGEIERNPPDTVPPNDGYSSWFNGIGGQDVLNGILSVPGQNINNIGVNVLRPEWVLGAVNAGLLSVPAGMTADEYAAAQGQFEPNFPVDRFTGHRSIRTNSFAPIFLFPAINFNNASAGTQPGWNDPALSGIQGIMGRWRNSKPGTNDLRWSSPATGGPGYNVPSIQNRDIFDYHNNLFQGDTNRVFTDFDVSQFYLEQGFFDGKMGLELAWNQQSRRQERFNAFSSGNSKQISIDISKWQAPGDTNQDGVGDSFLNENFGRPVVRWNDNSTTVDHDDQDTFRATLYGQLDFEDINDGWLGKALGTHTVTGLYEDRENNFQRRQTRGAWWADQGLYPGSGAISNGDNNNFRRIVKSQVYLGPDSSGLTSGDQLRLNLDGGIQTKFPAIGDKYGIWYYNNTGSVERGETNQWRIIESVQNLDITKETLESKAISIQSKLFGGNLVGMYAVREDELNSWRRIQQDAPSGPSGSLAQRLNDPGINETDGNFNPALQNLEATPFAIDKDDTTTWSVVGHYPENWLGELPWDLNLSGHYYEAESFQPAGGQVNILNQPLTSPLGTTKEWGVSMEIGSRLTIRYNNFETINANDRTNLPNAAGAGQLGQIIGRQNFYLTRIVDSEDSGLSLTPDAADLLLTFDTVPNNRQRGSGTDADLIGVSTYDEYYAKLLQILPPEVQAIYNFEIVRAGGLIEVFQTPLAGELRSTRDFVATGQELDIAGKLTKNISLSLNVAQQETVTSNTGPIAIPLANEIMQRIRDLGLYDVRDSPFQGESGAIGASRYEAVLRDMRLNSALDGTASAEQREWRTNVTGRYDFLEGRMNGLSIGGSLRYQSAVAAGYPTILDANNEAVPDVANPRLGPKEMNGDMFLRYRRKLSDKLEWSIQLNARNLYRKNGSNDIPVAINPDGNVSYIRIPNERQFFVTNTFKF